MPNTLTFSAPISLPAINTVRIVKASDVVNTNKTTTLIIELFTNDGTSWGTYPLMIRNGTCDKLVGPQTGAPDVDSIIAIAPVTVDENPDLATAFDRVMGAYVGAAAAGQPVENAMLDQMQQLALLPAGTTS